MFTNTILPPLPRMFYTCFCGPPPTLMVRSKHTLFSFWFAPRKEAYKMLHNRDIWNISGQQTLEVKLATGCTQKKIRNQRVTHPTNPLCIALCRSVPTTAAEQLKGVEASLAFSHSNTKYNNMAVCRNLVPLVNIKIAGKWMFIPLKNGINRYWSIPIYQKRDDPQLQI